MTTTKYALVPVVATPEATKRVLSAMPSMLGHGWPVSVGDAERTYSEIIAAAAPKELPEEVVDNMAAAYLSGYAMRTLEALNDGSKSVADAKKEAHLAGIRAALLAVLGE